MNTTPISISSLPRGSFIVFAGPTESTSPGFFSRRNVSFTADLMGYGWAILNIFQFAVAKALEGRENAGDSLENLGSVLKLLDSTRIFAAVNILTYLPLLVKSVKKAIRKEGVQSVDNAMKALFCLRSMAAHFKNFCIALDHMQVGSMLSNIGLKPAFDVVLGSTQYIAVVNFILSPINLVLNARSCYKLTQFGEEIDIKSMRNLTVNSEGLEEKYKAFIDKLKLKETKKCKFTKHLGVDGTAFKTQLVALEKINNPKAMLAVVKAIDNKISLGIRNYRAAMVADTISIVASALFVTSFALPVGYVLSAVAVSIYIGILVTRKLSDYQLDNQFNLILRETNSPFYKEDSWSNETKEKIGTGTLVWDFTKWLFAVHSYVQEPSFDYEAPRDPYSGDIAWYYKQTLVQELSAQE